LFSYFGIQLGFTNLFLDSGLSLGVLNLAIVVPQVRVHTLIYFSVSGEITLIEPERYIVYKYKV